MNSNNDENHNNNDNDNNNNDENSNAPSAGHAGPPLGARRGDAGGENSERDTNVYVYIHRIYIYI